jgi:hypothetical protein
MQAFGLITPSIALVKLPDGFQGASDSSPLSSNGRKDRAPAVHLGSRYPGEPGAISVFDFFPDVMLEEVLNIDHFYGALVFDKWLSNSDGRQAIFHRAHVSSQDQEINGSVGWIAEMIDNGGAFQGSDWCFRDSEIQGIYARTAVYKHVTSPRSFERWFDRLFAFESAHLEQIMSLLPPEWIAEEERDLWKLLERLLLRRRDVRRLVAESIAWLERRTIGCGNVRARQSAERNTHAHVR